jgi:hypothetical protein
MCCGDGARLSSSGPHAIKLLQPGNPSAGAFWYLALGLLACKGSEPPSQPLPVSRPAPAPAVSPPSSRQVRVPAEPDLSLLMADLASARACDRIRGQFQPLPAVGRPNVVTGTFWIRECRISNQGTRITFRLGGNGWQWVDEVKNKAGGTFSVRQYVRFRLTATFSGTLDAGYDPASHVATVWFSPEGEPEVQFAPVGKVNVDAEGAWSSVLSALGSVFAASPEEAAKKEAKALGAIAFKERLADGVSVTVDLCTGLTRFGLGRLARGKMAAPGIGQTGEVSVELQPGGLMIFGPLLAGGGMTLKAHVPAGTAGMILVCNDQAELLAKAFLEERALPGVHLLASRAIRGTATLHARPARCPMTVVARWLAVSRAGTPVMLDWRRPVAESGRSTGGRLIDCAAQKPQEPTIPR